MPKANCLFTFWFDYLSKIWHRMAFASHPALSGGRKAVPLSASPLHIPIVIVIMQELFTVST
jgi:hypothetical protein